MFAELMANLSFSAGGRLFVQIRFFDFRGRRFIITNLQFTISDPDFSPFSQFSGKAPAPGV
jgi:hypothetical protein